jgi:hypothetical protein
MDLFSTFIDKFNKDTHSVTLRTEDDYYSYAQTKFSQYVQEIECEYNVSSEELDDGVEWYDEYHDEVVSEFCLLLN